MKNTYAYVDSFVIPVKKKKLAAYKKLAKLMCKVAMEHGAISYAECVADDVEPGKVTSFPQSLKLKKDEITVVAWVTYKSRAQRNSVMKKIMSDPRMGKMWEGEMPFDGERMFWGGFKPIVRA